MIASPRRMRWSPNELLAVLLLLGPATACTAKDTAPTPRAAAPSPPAAEGPVVPVPPVPPISKWQVDPENSSVGFVCKHVLSNVRGMFPRPTGTLILDESTPANSKVSASIDASLISTGVEERDTHLKSSDFFDVAKYPAITFASTSVTKSGPTTYAATGNLTMHGVTKPVTLAINASPPFPHAGGVRRGIEASLSVNRKDYGLVWEYPGEGPGIVVGDTIHITIDAELVLEAQ